MAGNTSNTPTKGSATAEHLKALRTLMQEHGLDGYYIPAADEHINEYLPENRQRRAWLTQFTGSAGDCLVSLDDAWVFVDSRYHEQADTEVDSALFHISKIGQPDAKSMDDVIRGWVENGTNQKQAQTEAPPFVLGYDPGTLAIRQKDSFRRLGDKKQLTLKGVRPNLIDRLWVDAPANPSSAIISLPLSVTGESTTDKIIAIQEAMAKLNADILPVTKLDQIAWLLNARAQDIPYNPLFIAYALVHQDVPKVDLFLSHPERFSGGVQKALEDRVTLHPYEAYETTLADSASGKAVLIDVRHTTQLTLDVVEKANATIVRADTPIEKMKALKNKTELAAMAEANRRASRGKVRAWHWLDTQISAGKVVTEASFRDVIERFYAEEADFAGLSFNTISGAGANGSIVHYGTPSETKRLELGELFLIDSGCQFSIGGTTDDTRTWLVGESATPLQQLRYTEVLKSHINVAMQIFPVSTDGVRLDGIARSTLWQNGLDYGHGTGHGVGAFLNVHEGPNGIHRLATTAMEPGMITSIEPGFYEPGWGGIRLENLYQVVSLPSPETAADKQTKWLGFESLTWVPFDTRLIDRSRLSDAQFNWLRQYHEECVKRLELTDPVIKDWLQKRTAM